MKKSIRTYSELIELPTFRERYEYLKLNGRVGFETFGFDRYLNQFLYQRHKDWHGVRNFVIRRDQGNDLACDGYQIVGPIYIHHMNPITKEDILNDNPDIFNPELLISSSGRTHNGIHYSKEFVDLGEVISRSAGDTKLW